MDVRSFNKLAESVNRLYLYRLFGIPLNSSAAGIDLIDHRRKIAVEVKGAIAHDGLGTHNFSFKVGVNQIYDYNKNLQGYELFWAFMPFELTKPISEISPASIEGSIGRREVLLFDWNYIHSFTAFDDEVYKFHGASGAPALFRILGVPNPYKQRCVQMKETRYSTPLLFTGLEEKRICSKHYLKIARSQLYIRPDRISIISLENCIVYFWAHRCKSLLEAFVTTRPEGERQLAFDETYMVGSPKVLALQIVES